MTELKKLIKDVKIDRIISAIGLIVIGVLMLVTPSTVANVTCIIVAIALYVIAVIDLLGFFVGGFAIGMYSLVNCIGCLVVGSWLITTPAVALSVMDVVLTILIVIDGAELLERAILMERGKIKDWWLVLIFAIAILTLGTVGIFVSGIGMTYTGISLILSGVFMIITIIAFDRKISKIKKNLGIDNKSR